MSLAITPMAGFPRLDGPADLGRVLIDCLRDNAITPRAADVLVLAHKVVSKAEGRVIDLEKIAPSPRAQQLAAKTGKDPRMVEVILRESKRVVRAAGGVVITENRLGLICANAGVDRSNAGPHQAVLLPEDPDASARALRAALESAFGVAPPVLIADTHGRPWREGATGLCIGLSGIDPFHDYRGTHDLYDYEMQSEVECVADELCAAATLVMGQGDEGIPAALVRGLTLPLDEASSARQLLREPGRDLFR